MTFSRDSKVIQWAYLLEKDGPPRQTSLCALFWRTVLLTPVKLLWLAIVLCACVGGIGWLIYQGWIRRGMVGFIVIGMAAAWLVLYGIATLTKRSMSQKSRQPSVLVEGFKAVKGKVCPLVEIR